MSRARSKSEQSAGRLLSAVALDDASITLKLDKNDCALIQKALRGKVCGKLLGKKYKKPKKLFDLEAFAFAEAGTFGANELPCESCERRRFWRQKHEVKTRAKTQKTGKGKKTTRKSKIVPARGKGGGGGYSSDSTDDGLFEPIIGPIDDLQNKPDPPPEEVDTDDDANFIRIIRKDIIPPRVKQGHENFGKLSTTISQSSGIKTCAKFISASTSESGLPPDPDTFKRCDKNCVTCQAVSDAFENKVAFMKHWNTLAPSIKARAEAVANKFSMKNAAGAKNLKNEPQEEYLSSDPNNSSDEDDSSDSDDDINSSPEKLALAKRLFEKIVKESEETDALIKLLPNCHLLTKRQVTYKKLQKLYQNLRVHQTSILRRTNSLYKMYIRNIDAIFRLGFSPVLIEARAVAISEGISQIHDCHETWDILMEDVLWETKGKEAVVNSVIRSIIDQAENEFHGFTEEETECFTQLLMDKLLSNGDLAKLFMDVDTEDLKNQWNKTSVKIEKDLIKLEKDFRSLCIEYGVTNPLPFVAET